MAAIARARGTTGLRVASTFSGCGGSCLGLEMAGFDVVFANEFIEEARATYVKNHAASVFLDPRDIRSVHPEEVLERAGVKAGELDVFEGSPPCSSFSMVGAREKGWGQVKAYSGVKQRTDDLFFEWLRLLEGVKPKTFIAENVSGFVRGKAFGYFHTVMKRLEAAGYVAAARELDAQWLGVPQQRGRVILVGVRRDLASELGIATSSDVPYPKPFARAFTLAEAIPHIIGEPSGIEPTIEELEAARRAMVPSLDAEWNKLRPGVWSEKYFNLIKAPVNKPSPCITVKGGEPAASVTHPLERRKFTIRELRRICGFPDDFELTGTFAQQWERLARSVPPPMMFAIGRELRDRVFAPLGLVREGWIEASSAP
jgi:DNA (cytosine-5)-methyltransferase 1